MLTKKEIKKAYLIGYKAGQPKRKSQDEIDLETVAKIKKYAVRGKIAILRVDQFFYDSPDYVVEGYEDQRVTLIPATYTAWRFHQKEEERFADAPYSLRIIKQKKEN